MAEKYIDQVDRRFMDKARQILSDLPQYVEKFANEKYEYETKPSTIYAYMIDIRAFLTHFAKQLGVPLKDITVSDLARISRQDHVDYLASLRSSGYGLQARNRLQAAVIGLYDYLINAQIYDIDYNIPKSIPRAKEPKKNTIDYFTDEDLTTIKKSLDEGEGLSGRQRSYYKSNEQRDNLVVVLLLTTGMRVSELVGINIQDFRRNYTEVDIVRKEHATQTVYLSDEARDAVLTYMNGERKKLLEKAKKQLPELYQDCVDPLLLTVRGNYAGRISTVAVERLVKTHAHDTDSKTRSCHTFRRTYGSSVLAATQNLALTQALLGHSSPQTTQAHYARASQTAQQDVAGIIKLRETPE